MGYKNIVYVGMSLDGFIAGKNGELDWLDAIPGINDVDMGYDALMDEIDALVMGRTTFEVVLGFGIEWPYKKPVFVLSRSLHTIPENLEGKVHLVNGSVKEVLEMIHAKGHRTLYIDGGRTVQEFMRADCIDELRLTRIPIVLGGGYALFGELDKSLLFEHVKTEVFLDQIVQSYYRRKR